MAHPINLYEAKTHLSELVERAAAGEEIVIAKAGTARARLMPLAATPPVRKPGAMKGDVWIADDFDDPLPPDLLAAFYGGALPATAAATIAAPTGQMRRRRNAGHR